MEEGQGGERRRGGRGERGEMPRGRDPSVLSRREGDSETCKAAKAGRGGGGEVGRRDRESGGRGKGSIGYRHVTQLTAGREGDGSRGIGERIETHVIT